MAATRAQVDPRLFRRPRVVPLYASLQYELNDLYKPLDPCLGGTAGLWPERQDAASWCWATSSSIFTVINQGLTLVRFNPDTNYTLSSLYTFLCNMLKPTTRY